MTERSRRAAQRIKGPVVPLNICFNEDGSVDFGAVRRYAVWLCESGVPVLSLAYGSSEFASLSDQEVWQVTAEIAEVNAGRSLFVTATGRWKTSQCREFLAHADQVGADSVRVQVDPGVRQDPDLYLAYFDSIEGASDIPLVLEDAAPPVSLATELAARPNIVGAMIHDFQAYLDLTMATREENFSTICAGRMRYMMFAHPVGSPAYQCGIAPFLPGVALEFYDLLEAGRNEQAWEMVFRYEDPWMGGDVDVPWLVAIKTAIYQRGLYPSNRPCPPAPEVTAEQVSAVRRVIERAFGPIEKVEL